MKREIAKGGFFMAYIKGGGYLNGAVLTDNTVHVQL